MPSVSSADLLSPLPPAPTTSAAQVRAARAADPSNTFYVVLDDDPTGTQSVADLPVITSWRRDDFTWAMGTGAPAVYVMLNSRSLSPQDARQVNEEAVQAALAAALEAGRTISFVSRSDSTLRGHFPVEPDTIMATLHAHDGARVDGILIVPAFGDAGRVTVHGIHHAGSAAEGYLPVGQTEFARDATFGYHSSDLAQWIEEKTQGRRKACEVTRIDIDMLRSDRDGVVDLLRSAHDGAAIIADAVVEEDLREIALALARAEAAGSTFIYRVGPPFMRARLGQDIPAPVTPERIAATRTNAPSTSGGLVVIGSHVALTTRQLDHLRKAEHPLEIEVEVPRLLDPTTRDSHVRAVIDQAVGALMDGNVVVRTSRNLVSTHDPQESLAIARSVSEAVVQTVQGVLARSTPRFVVAKGGITSSDVASKGLGIRHALVVGPMLPGITSMWAAQDGPAEGIPYVVFPGNVGDETSLTSVVRTLSL
ncbi:hypothetical protein I6B53_03025 [Schaalia sp. 19OD2882]|uniref:four-carbon acid sugar kinase family protein n=1 Tax=Schaalia sp. 19OD2882 TaxID=2794089 RepID=UPI001C1EA8CF|nr:four-carbon acid sugar kinase family protein [Schaalia sp. 19OD2882]QWW20088.1 hypothetical protein I6B53_03025 [Schaalia sp. 19OD2882]